MSLYSQRNESKDQKIISISTSKPIAYVVGYTRSLRSSTTASSPYHFTLSSQLPSQSVCLSIVDNKVQIIQAICDTLLEQFQEKPTPTELVITGPDPVPIAVQAGTLTKRHDLTVTHEEADIIIAHHVVHIARESLCLMTLMY